MSRPVFISIAQGLCAAFEALNRSRKDLRAMLKLLENGKMLDGRSYIIHNARDPVASPDLSLWVARR